MSGERWIRSHRQDLVIIASSKGYRVLTPDGDPVSRSNRPREWRRGLSRTLRAMPDGPRLMVLGDTPSSKIVIPGCLRAHRERIASCQQSRSRSIDTAHDDAERAAAEANGATFRSLNGKICSYDPCPVIVGRTLLWRDGSHLTATYARLLAPSLKKAIVESLPSD